MPKSTKEQFVQEQKQAATIKVKTVVLAIIWLATIIGASITGWVGRSNFESEVASRVDFRLEQRELVKEVEQK